MTQHIHSSLKETSMADQNVTQLANKHTDQLGLITKDEKKKCFSWRSNQSILKEISPGISSEGMMLKLKLQSLATSCEELTHWKRLWCWEGLGAGGEGDDRGWDGWVVSLTRWMWVSVNSGSWRWTGRPGMLRFMGSQRVGHDWATDLIWSDIEHYLLNLSSKRRPFVQICYIFSDSWQYWK